MPNKLDPSSLKTSSPPNVVVTPSFVVFFLSFTPPVLFFGSV